MAPRNNQPPSNAGSLVVPAKAGTPAVFASQKPQGPLPVAIPLAPRLRGGDVGSSPASPSFLALSAALAGVFDLAAAPNEAAAFSGALHWSGGRGFVLARLEATAARWLSVRSAPSAALLAHVAAGGVEARIDAAPLALPPGSLIFLDLGEPFELTVASSAGLNLLAVDRAAAAERFPAEGLWHGLALDAASAGAKVCAAALQAFDTTLAAAAPGEAAALAAGLVDLAARAAELELGERGGADALATLTQVRRFIDRNLNSVKLDTAMVARAFGFSHASLYRLFAPLGGVATYIRKARLARARRLVLAPQTADRRLGEIALAVGFRSATVFNRLFLAEFGVTPGEARAQGRSGFDGARAPVASGDGELAARLRALS